MPIEVLTGTVLLALVRHDFWPWPLDPNDQENFPDDDLTGPPFSRKLYPDIASLECLDARPCNGAEILELHADDESDRLPQPQGLPRKTPLW